MPEFGDRFWVYQAVDLRSDSFIQLGKMYGTTPGFYLLVGPSWRGQVPKGIANVFRASTNTGFIASRIFMDDTAEDRRAIQRLLRQVMMYPLAEYDGTMKMLDWSTIIFRAERDRPLLLRHQEQDAQIQFRRFAHPLRAGRSAARGTARQLALPAPKGKDISLYLRAY